jgi:hypothetical protein
MIWASKIYSLEANIKTLNGRNFFILSKSESVPSGCRSGLCGLVQYPDALRFEVSNQAYYCILIL